MSAYDPFAYVDGCITMTIPNTRQRKALVNMTPGYPERKGTLLTGNQTISELVESGWVIQKELSLGDVRYWITPAGEAARSAKPEAPVPPRSLLNTIKPMLKAVATSIAKPRSN